jgi:TIGR03009 family protein
MRGFPLALAGLLVGTTLYAQQPPAPAPAAPQSANLDTLLQRWELEMKNIQQLSAELRRTTVDKVREDKDEFVGVAKYMKPNFAILEMQKKTNPQVFEKYICSGTYLYEFVPGSKLIRAHELPPPKAGQVGDDNFLSFLFGMKAEEAKKRYELKIVKEDQYYYYVHVLPRLAADKADFQEARLALNKTSFLPREVRFTQPNGNEIIWDISKIDPSARLDRREFGQPATPPGWNLQRVPRADATPQPRVVRPQQ